MAKCAFRSEKCEHRFEMHRVVYLRNQISHEYIGKHTRYICSQACMALIHSKSISHQNVGTNRRHRVYLRRKMVKSQSSSAANAQYKYIYIHIHIYCMEMNEESTYGDT